MNFIVKVFQSIPLFVQYLVLPLALMSILLFYQFQCKLIWFMITLLTGLYLLLMHFSAVWEMSVGHYTRYLIEILFLIVCILSYRKIRDNPLLIKPKLPGYIVYAITLTAVIILLVLNINNIRASFILEKAIHLQFPLQNGTYLINDGGDGSISNLVNYHYQDERNIQLGYNKAERYANDIVKLDAYGFEGINFSNEKALEDYHIFGETVYSPCDGEVFYVQDGKDDIYPGAQVKDTGNGIVIKADDVYVLLWHLKKNSIIVKEGDMVKAGDPIAQVGNSGITQGPHLHIHAAKKHFLYGEGIPVTYDSKNPIKNRIFRK